MLVTVWVVVSSSQILGAWEDWYQANGVAQAHEEEHKEDCRVVAGTLTYED
jgi:phosphosulfolactate phosphohydrolase-like enzyme